MNTLGKEGVAREFLKKKGFSILQENYSTPFGEIDIIAMEKDVLVLWRSRQGRTKPSDPLSRR